MSRRPLGTEEIVALAAADPDLRVLRRAVAPLPVASPRGALLLSCCAVEGVRHGGEDRLRSLSLRPFRADVSGTIVGVGSLRRWRSNSILAAAQPGDGEPACDAEAASLLADAEIVVTHDARAMRGPVERAFPVAAGRPWICTRRDVDWRAVGLEEGTLPDALRQTGHFIGSDDPGARVDGLLRLLTHRTTSSSGTLLGGLLASACRTTWFVEAEDLPPAGERMVAAAGYSLVPGTRRWWREVDGEHAAGEVEWLTWQVCGGADRPRVREIGWRTRHTVH